MSTENTELPKAYDPSAVESEAYHVWTEERAFHAEPTDPGKPYAIVIPPPNVTAALHLGHALNNTLQDVLTRYHRMLGDNTCWLPGTDHAGIATQTIVDRRLQAGGEPALKDYKAMEDRGEGGREKFLAKVEAWKDEYERTITGQLKAMGCSCDWDRQAFTMDPIRARAVREAFFQLFKDGLIYRGKRLVNWDPATQTALADDEVEMEEVDGYFYYLRYPLVPDTETGGHGDKGTRGKGDEGNPPNSALSTQHSAPSYVTVATTRPETMLGDTAVAMNPKDPRAAALRGRKVLLPIVNREIPIIEDDYVVLSVAMGGDPADPKAQFATGFLKVTPAHDPNDYDIGQRHQLAMINVMAPDASISEKQGWPADDFAKADAFLRESLIGQSREEARKRVVKWFKDQGLLEDIKPYRHSVGHSYRSHVPIEPYLSDQWYCKVTDDRLRGAALRAMNATQIEPAHASRDREGAGTAAQQPAPSASEPGGWPLAYFITFTTYGTWLHGTDKGSVDRDHNIPGTPYLAGDEDRERRDFERMGEPSATLDEPRRTVVQETVAEVCRHRGWTLHVVHARTNHAHVVVSAAAPPEKVMNDFKSYATRRLREAGLASPTERIWTRHGSTRYLPNDGAVKAAGDYVHDQQGELLNPGPLTAATIASREREGAVSGAGTGSAGAEPPLPDGRGSRGAPWEGKLNFYPQRYAKTFQTWHENIRDWCISRQLWWGHRIPVWISGFGTSWTLSEKRQEIIGRWINEGRLAGATGSVIDDENQSAASLAYFCVRREDDTEVVKYLESEFRGVQDPDVLDTWFSSGLWPMSTLEWPDPSALSSQHSALNTWNPSSLLTTAREIITLWVSRMVMFNLYFRDCLPFYDVFIHAMIQDGEGQKMSKSLGNGVDPLDIIHSHGADAMRYTLAAMTTQTQDLRMPVDLIDPHSGTAFSPAKITNSAGYVVAAPIQQSPKDPKKKMVSSYGFASGLAKPTAEMPLAKNTSGKFDLGRNFCNKIWNAARFALMNLASASDSASGSALSTQHSALPESIADRWIVSRFNRTVAECDASLKDYRFDQYAKACYDFFWRDLCDWYLEAIKPAMKDPARAAQTANVLASVLDGALRLMHPVIPFITETIWWRLNDARPSRGLPGWIDCRPSKRLVKATWPAVGPFDESAETDFPKLQEIIGAIRQLRNDYNVKPSQVVTVSILAPSEMVASIQSARELVETLAGCTLKAAASDLQLVADAAKASAAGCEIFVEGMVDAAAEKARNVKRVEELTKQRTALRGRLSNESYTAKAPPHLVQQTRDQLAEVEAELKKLE